MREFEKFKLPNIKMIFNMLTILDNQKKFDSLSQLHA